MTIGSLLCVSVYQFVASITLRDGHITTKVNTDDILWAKSDHIYLEIKTKDRTFLQRMSLKEFMEMVSDNGIKWVHRSWAVNLKNIKHYSLTHLFVEGKKIPLSNSYRQEVLKYLEQES